MQKIESVDLDQLVKEASVDLIHKRKQEAIVLVQRLMARIEGLTREKTQAETKVREYDGKITSAQDKLNKIKAGDWSVLAGLEKEEKGLEVKQDVKQEGNRQ